MTVKYLGNGRYIGLSTDTKPTAANTAVDALFWETDTGKTYANSGAAWVGFSRAAYGSRTKVYKIGSTYYAERTDSSLAISSGTFETVLQGALDADDPLGTTVYLLQSTNFDFSASFAGITMKNYRTLILGPNTVLRPPAAFAGNVFIFGGAATQNANIYGGIIQKAATNKNWYGITFSSSSVNAGVLWSGVHGTRINQPYGGMLFITSSDGWLTACEFDRVIVNEPVVGFEFSGGGTNPGLLRSVFDRCEVQNAVGVNDLLYGFFNVKQKDLTFKNCNVWDLATTSQKTMLIDPTASNINIEGGIVVREQGYFVDNSTTYRGNWHTPTEWDVPRYGGQDFVDSIFVRNGRRRGWYDTATIAGADGLLAGALTAATGEGTTSPVVTYANGTLGINRPTLTTTGDNAGNHYTRAITCRGWNPIYKIRFRLNTTSLTRAFMGLTSAVVSLTGDDPLNALSGVMLCKRSADTTWQIGCNDGTGVTTFTSTGVSIGTGIVTFELIAQDAMTNKFKWSINQAAWADLTDTNIPAQGTGLTVQQEIETNESGVAKNFDIFGVYVESS